MGFCGGFGDGGVDCGDEVFEPADAVGGCDGEGAGEAEVS